MAKNIYNLLNNAKIDTGKYENTELEQSEKDNIFNCIMGNQKGKKAMKKRGSIKRRILVFTAVFAAASVSVVGMTLNTNKNAGVSNSQTSSSEAKKGNSFMLRAGAYESDSDSNSGKLILKDNGTGVNNFTSTEFQITGKNIADVRLSVNKGCLAKIIKTKTDEKTDAEDENATEISQENKDFSEDNEQITDDYIIGYSNGSNSMSVSKSENAGSNNSSSENDYNHIQDYVGTDEGNFIYDYTNLGSSVQEKYDPNVYYGFCIPEERYKEISNEYHDDLQKIFHACYDEFNGGELTVEVTYTDGEKEKAVYSLASGKLQVDDKNYAIQEFVTNENDPYIYGIIGSEE